MILRKPEYPLILRFSLFGKHPIDMAYKSFRRDSPLSTNIETTCFPIGGKEGEYKYSLVEKGYSIPRSPATFYGRTIRSTLSDSVYL